MTLHDPIGRALTGPVDHRHIPQGLDRITGISAASCPAAPEKGSHRRLWRAGPFRAENDVRSSVDVVAPWFVEAAG
jgi:hypothetical protein